MNAAGENYFASSSSSPSTPTMFDMPLHEWINVVTTTIDEYRNGISGEEIWRLHGEQRKLLVETPLWVTKKAMYTRLSYEYKKGRINRIEIGIYKGVESNVPKNYFSLEKMPTPNSVCIVCTESDDALEGSERFRRPIITCISCGSKLHVQCGRLYSMSDEFTFDYWQKTSDAIWRCCDCKLCHVCGKGPQENTDLMICEKCERAEHLSCGNSSPGAVLNSPWYCSKCTDASEEADAACTTKSIHQNMETVGSESTERQSIGSDSRGRKRNQKQGENMSKKSKIDLGALADKNSDDQFMGPSRAEQEFFENYSIADLKNWNVQKTANFFERMGYVESADALRAEDIDGEALLLLQCKDVMTRMNLKVGPALKTFRVVNIIQSAYYKESGEGGSS